MHQIFYLQAIYDSLPYEKKNHDPINTLQKVSSITTNYYILYHVLVWYRKVFLSNDVENLFWIIVQRSVYINIGNVDIVIKKKIKNKRLLLKKCMFTFMFFICRLLHGWKRDLETIFKFYKPTKPLFKTCTGSMLRTPWIATSAAVWFHTRSLCKLTISL